jgi:uncharacterized protein YjbI with pentapeptide repeats
MSEKPKVIDHPLYQLIRHENLSKFNSEREAGENCDMKGCDFRGLDLRGINAKGLDWRDCYFRGTDLRGVDLRETRLEGASLANAKLSGAYLPLEIDSGELMLSITHGARLRYIKNKQ